MAGGPPPEARPAGMGLAAVLRGLLGVVAAVSGAALALRGVGALTGASGWDRFAVAAAIYLPAGALALVAWRALGRNATDTAARAVAALAVLFALWAAGALLSVPADAGIERPLIAGAAVLLAALFGLSARGLATDRAVGRSDVVETRR